MLYRFFTLFSIAVLDISDFNLSISHHLLIQYKLTLFLERLIQILDMNRLCVQSLLHFVEVDFAQRLLIHGEAALCGKHLVKSARVVNGYQCLVVRETAAGQELHAIFELSLGDKLLALWIHEPRPEVYILVLGSTMITQKSGHL